MLLRNYPETHQWTQIRKKERLLATEQGLKCQGYNNIRSSISRLIQFKIHIQHKRDNMPVMMGDKLQYNAWTVLESWCAEGVTLIQELGTRFESLFLTHWVIYTVRQVGLVSVSVEIEEKPPCLWQWWATTLISLAFWGLISASSLSSFFHY